MGYARRSRHVIPPPPLPKKWSLHCKNKVEGKSDTLAQEDHATYTSTSISTTKKKKWSLHYKKVEGKSDAHAQEEHATHRTVTILSHVIKWTRLIGHSRACVVNIFIFGGTKTGYEMTPTYYFQLSRIERESPAWTLFLPLSRQACKISHINEKKSRQACNISRISGEKH